MGVANLKSICHTPKKVQTNVRIQEHINIFFGVCQYNFWIQ